MMDRIGRMFCLAGYGDVSFAGFGTHACELSEICVPHSQSRALAAGRAARQARGNPVNPED
jgi:hypothetical protein